MRENEDTIFALSSGQGKAGVAVVRVSGVGLDFLPNPQSPRTAKLIDFYGIDRLLAIWFKAPNSFTGEDVVELHCHGGAAVIEKIFEKLKGFGFRHAERGEFTRRAFMNGKMDLTEVDGMRALIDARTESQRLRALKGVAGKDGEVFMKWRGDMVELAALSAARLDYASDDLPKNIDARIRDKKSALSAEIKKALSSKANIIESGFRIVLAGKTNVGKSSLFNRILGESRAIVSDIHGTTRDVISAELDLDGFLARLSDTAGIRESKDEIEKIGIEKTEDEIKNAELVLWVYDAQPAEIPEGGIVVVNKSDLLNPEPPARAASTIYVSAKTGSGIPELMESIKEKIREKTDGWENDIGLSDRVRSHLLNAAAELESKDCAAETEAEHIMAAADEIGMILGIIGTEEIYDSVFGQLCLGK